MNMKSLILALVAGVLLATTWSSEAQRKQYRWVDEDGVVHYGDRIPPEYAEQQVDELSRGGITVGTREARKTEEELVEEVRLAEAAAEAERIAEQQARHDRMLLNTYITLADLEEARERHVTALEAQISLSRSSVTNLEAQLAVLEADAERHESAGRDIPDELAARISSVSRQLESSTRFVEQREQELANVEAKFDADIERYLELRGSGRR